MKKLFVLALIAMLAVPGCGKKEMGCTSVSPQSEEAQIKAYASTNSIVAMKHTSGMYYQVLEPGTGVTPSPSSTVTATYTGKLLNGYTFDSRTDISFELSRVIEGWQIGIPLIKKGGKIKLIIPSTYAYGCYGNPDARIPSNSVLYFDISLVDVK